MAIGIPERLALDWQDKISSPKTTHSSVAKVRFGQSNALGNLQTRESISEILNLVEVYEFQNIEH